MFSVLTLSTALALANAPDAFRFEYSTRTEPDGSAYLIVRAAQAQEGVVMTIAGNDGTSYRRKLNLPAGGNLKVRWEQLPQDVRYEVRFGKQTSPSFAFNVRRPAGSAADIPNLELLSSDHELVKEQRIRYRLPFAIIRYHHTVYGLDGQVLAENKSSGELSFAAGEELDLSWSTREEVFLIKTRVEDVAGRYAQDIRAPWSFDIPHTDLVFSSGSSKIRPSEAHKLDEAFAILANTLSRLDKAAAAVRGSVPVTLFVVGHTDTVGSSSSNERLSKARARSIARYFKKKGAWCGIEYAGMGEAGQAVATADNVDNEANRRVVYTLALSTPTGEGRPSPSQYRTLTAPRPRTLFELPPLPQSYVAAQEKKEEELRAVQPAAESQTLASAPGARRSAQGPQEHAAPETSPAAQEEPKALAKAETSKAPAPRQVPAVPLQSKKTPGAHKSKDCSVSKSSGGVWTTLFGLAVVLGFQRKLRRRLRRSS